MPTSLLHNSHRPTCGPSGLEGDDALKRRDEPQLSDLRVDTPVMGLTPARQEHMR